jgi:ribosomal protein L12E/L44/L45/RPP1/RPP2
VESLTLEEYRDGIRASYRNNSFEEYLRKSAGEKAAIRARFLRRIEGALEAVYDKIRKLPDRVGADNVRDMGLQYLVQKSLEGKVPLDLARKISGFVTSRAPAVAARPAAARPAADAEEAEEEAEEEQGGGGRRRRVTRRQKTKGRTRRAVKSRQRRSR